MGNNPSVVGADRPKSLEDVPRHLIESLRFDLDVPESAAYNDHNNGLGGVGIVFVKDANNDLFVNLMVKGGPAHLSGKICQGDRLVYIDGLDLTNENEDNFAPVLSGYHGTSTVIGFERGYGQKPFFVRLVRDERCYPDLVALPPPGFQFPTIPDPSARRELVKHVAPPPPKPASPIPVANGPNLERVWA